MKEYKKVFKVFVAGQEDRECEWLKEMSKSGYHLENVSFASYYTFKKGEAKDYTYMIDMKEKDQVNEYEYLQIYEENGIEYIDKSAEFYYFRGESDADVVSLIQCEQGRYLSRINSHKKIIALCGIFNIFIFIVNFINSLKVKSELLGYTTFLNLLVGIFSIWIYILICKKECKLKEEGVRSPYKTNIKDWPKLYYLGLIVLIMMIIYGVISLFELLNL